mgnify:FL=1
MFSILNIVCRKLLTAFFIVMLLSACGDETTTVEATGDDTGMGPGALITLDSDNDGLTDEEELLYGTSIMLRDTDGDGYDDYQEVIEFGFNPANNNFRFNPLIADVPKLAVEIASVPSVNMRYETTTGNTQTIGVQRSEESARSVSVSETSTNSLAVEQTHTVGVEAGVQTGPTGGASLKVNYEYSKSTTTESSFSNTEEQREENREALSRSEAFEEENGISETGGELELNVRIRNDGDLAFRLDNLILGAVMIDPLNTGQVIPVANLDLDTTFLNFPETTLAPSQSTGNLLFDNDDLTVEEAKNLLRDASGLIVDVSLSELVNEDGVAFAFNRTEVGLKTASVIIDFGGYRATERYLVATNVDAATQRVNLQTIMQTILRAPYEVDTNGSLTSLRNIAESAATDAYWVAVVITDDGLQQTVSTYNPVTAAYDFESLTLQSGDVMSLTYMEDADQDGLGLRREFLIGTNPNLADTDGDLLEDGEEVEGVELTVDRGDGAGEVTVLVRSDPNIIDTDGDGLSDAEEFSLNDPAQRSDPSSADTDGDRMLDSYDRLPTLYQPLELGPLTAGVILDNTGPQTPPLIHFSWSNSPELTSGEVLNYIVRRQEVNVGEPFLEITDHATGTCVGGSVCFPESEGLFFGSNAFIETEAILQFEKDYKYLMYAEVDGNLIYLDSVTIDTATSRQSFTVSVTELRVNTCIDSYKPSSFYYNLVCELFWDFKIDGLVLSSQSEFEKVDATTDEIIEHPGQMTFEVADLPGSCFTLEAEIWESDTSVSSNRDGDDLLRPIRETYCYPWDTTSGGKQRDAEFERNTGSLIENIDVTMFYSITLN